MTIEEIQDQINELQLQVDLLTQERTDLDWDNAPVICDLNGSRWVLGPESPEFLSWDKAIAWCKSVGGELPSRNILLECYMNEEIRPLFTAPNYWSSTEFTAPNAWIQSFANGLQSNTSKTNAYYVRAVRRLDI